MLRTVSKNGIVISSIEIEGAPSLLAVRALSFGSYPLNEISVVQIEVSGGVGEVSEEDSSYNKHRMCALLAIESS